MQPLWVVASGDQQRPDGVGAEAVSGDEVGSGRPREGGEDGIQGLDLPLETLDPPGQLPQREFGGTHRGRGIPRTQPGRGGHHLPDGGVPEHRPQWLGPGDDEGPHLVDGVGAAMAGRAPNDTKSPDGLDISGPGLGLRRGFPRLRGAGRRHGVDRVGLAMAASPTTIGAAHLDHNDLLIVQVTGQPGSIGPGAFDSDALDGPEAVHPARALR